MLSTFLVLHTVELRWIAAHTGLWGNEKAEKLAKLGNTSDSNKLTKKFPNSIKNNGKRVDLSIQR